MKSNILSLVLITVAFTGSVVQCATDKLAGKFVWDLLKPALTAAEVQALTGSRAVGAYPQYNTIRQTSFRCSSKAQAGFYADEDTQCQVFHRCDQNMNQTSYLCTNTTIFNQITLVCNSWYNVDCSRSQSVEDYANSRLYSDKPLFDSPPADYLAPSQVHSLISQGLALSPAQQEDQLTIPKRQFRPFRTVKLTTTRKPTAAPRPANVTASGNGTANTTRAANATTTAPTTTAAPKAAIILDDVPIQVENRVEVETTDAPSGGWVGFNYFGAKKPTNVKMTDGTTEKPSRASILKALLMDILFNDGV
ncbi:hypothetical protein BV898_02828 [Hypsibius exemplaris]|uniref:Chitin-binding type-2 domain-containing protein n=1 Tax=Hypsibius exemplaris TaxID=2072580 RepID=A0A1W0X7U5_HYPEX|nr:hypothetical protein BV898_02828 [Hypsibius exemplaris]